MKNCSFVCRTLFSAALMFVFALLLCLGASAAETVPVQIAQAVKSPVPETGAKQQGVLQNPPVKLPNMTPEQDGKITNVTFLPADQWRTGTSVQIHWTWPGYENSLADITLWRGSTQIAVIASSRAGGSVGWIVPYNLPSGAYSVKVNNAWTFTAFSEANNGYYQTS